MVLQVGKGVDASLPSYAQHAPHGQRRGAGLLALTLTDGKRGEAAGTGRDGPRGGGRRASLSLGQAR